MVSGASGVILGIVQLSVGGLASNNEPARATILDRPVVVSTVSVHLRNGCLVIENTVQSTGVGESGKILDPAQVGGAVNEVNKVEHVHVIIHTLLMEVGGVLAHLA